MSECYVIKNISSNSYININGEQYKSTNKKDEATLFPTQEIALEELNKLPSTYRKYHFVQKTNSSFFSKATYFKNDELHFQRDDNQYLYLGETNIEKNKMDNIPQKLIEIVEFVSELKKYVTNLQFLEKELDLKILDVRHYMRANETKLGTVHMSKLAYYLQDLERQRAICKKNRLCCSIFSEDTNEFLKTSNIKEIENICNSQYRYRRIDEDFFNSIIGKNSSKLTNQKNS